MVSALLLMLHNFVIIIYLTLFVLHLRTYLLDKISNIPSISHIMKNLSFKEYVYECVNKASRMCALVLSNIKIVEKNLFN